MSGSQLWQVLLRPAGEQRGNRTTHLGATAGHWGPRRSGLFLVPYLSVVEPERNQDVPILKRVLT